MCFPQKQTQQAPVAVAPAPAPPTPPPEPADIGSASTAEEKKNYGTDRPSLRVDRTAPPVTGGAGLKM